LIRIQQESGISPLNAYCVGTGWGALQATQDSDEDSAALDIFSHSPEQSQ